MAATGWLPLLAALAVGIALGFALAWALGVVHGRTAQALAAELARHNAAQSEAALFKLRAAVGEVSEAALQRSNAAFLTLAEERLTRQRELHGQALDTRQGRIDEHVGRMGEQLEKLRQLVQDLEKDRAAKFGALSAQLLEAGRQTAALTETTRLLREALANSRARGQWGERMAEDVLRLAGFIEGVNYRKQQAQGDGGRPDFTFLLPRGLTLNMDVKFPLDNYLRFLDAETEAEGERHRRSFLADVKGRIKEVTGRAYISPERNTVDYVLLFIPNEQIYAFIHEQDAAVLDEGLRHKVVLCSPITLFAVLAVIRQAVDNFALERASAEMLSLLGAFDDQWKRFRDKMDTVGKRLEAAQGAFQDLATTRSRQLERVLDRLGDLRRARDEARAPALAPPAEEGR